MKTFLNPFGNLINGYSLLRAEHPSNTKRDGICMYYKNCLPAMRRTDLSDLS